MSDNKLEQMEIVVSDLEPCRKKAEITVSSNDIEEQTTSIVREFASQVTLPGFRQGKAPAALVRKRFASAIKEELLKRIQIAAVDRLQEMLDTDMVTIPVPETKIDIPEAGEMMKYAVSFDVAPKIELPDYKGVEITREAVEISKKDVEDEIDRYRNEYAEMSKVDSPVKAQDMLEISFSSDIDCPDDAPESMRRLANAERTWCWLTPDYELIPGLLKALEGKNKGEEVEFDAEFPEDFVEPLLAGKKARYKVTVKEIERRVPISDDEKLCERLGVDDMETLEKRIEENLKRIRENEIEMDAKNKAFENILKKVGELPLPPSFLDQEARQELSNMINTLKTQEDAEKFKDEIEKHKEEAKKRAEERLTRFFIAKEILRQENIEVSQQELNSAVSGLSRVYGKDEKQMRQIMVRNGGMDQLHIDMTIGKAKDFIYDNAEMAEKKAAAKADEKKAGSSTKSDSAEKKSKDKTEKK